MAYYAMPYRVLFHDTMAQGSHHFLTNFKFQCEAREHFYFGIANEPTPAGKALLETMDVVTLEGYSRNLAPVAVGETVGILMSSEDLTPSAFRLCFRVVRHDGKPVACGFQTLLCTRRGTGQIMVSPEPTYAFMTLKERLRRPSFKDRVLAGGPALKQIFDEESIRIATEIASSYTPKLVPEIVLPSLEALRQRAELAGIVFLFPGQGSWEPSFIRSLQSVYPNATAMLERMDRVAAERLGRGFLAACHDQGEATRLLEENPDVAQVGIFAASVVAARYLIDRGVEPTLLLGHSFGELASLCVGGAIDDETGAALVCRRVQSLQGLRQEPGGMHAVFADEGRTISLVEGLAPSSLEIAVVNHPGQTVVSGTATDLQRLKAAMAADSVVGAPLKSRYPFHSQLLKDAVAPFADALGAVSARPLTTAAYSAVDGGLYARVPDLTALARHFVRPAVFSDAVESAYTFGGRVFIECSGSKVLSGLVQEILRGRPGVQTMNTFAAEVARLPGVSPQAPAPQDTRPAAPPPAPASSVVPNEKPAAPSMAVPTTPLEGPEPIAIVALGCVLPGAANPETLWRRLLARQSGIVDLGDLDATLIDDFKGDRAPAPDKTYSLLCGRVNPEDRDPDHTLHARFGNLPTVGQFFAQAASQCLANLRTPLPPADRLCCVVGATADGSRELDEALVDAGVETHLAAAHTPAATAAKVSQALARTSGRTLDESSELSCPRAFNHVARELFGTGVSVLAVDAACASSLYAIDIGVNALRDNRCDVAVCGGAFAPGPASTCLFAQFQGLSARGSRPLDAGADGVVFGEGSALFVLKRLSDAVAAGDRIHAVIRGVAASSDGKSPSVMEPKPGGQLLAIRRASERAKIAPSTLQFIDAHATATPVGDAVEFTSLREAVGPPSESRPRVRVGSLKAAIGHTGWVAGAASLVEMCQALAARSFPPQLNFATPNPKFNLAASNIAIQADPSPWPANADGLPRRAGVNGFGFGGCNAHLVVEEFDPAWHTRPIAPATKPSRSNTDIAIVGVSSFFPGDTPNPSLRFGADEVRLPSKVRILPDIADQMDAGHILAIKCAQAIVETLPASWEQLRPDTGVVVGFDGKTRRGIDSLLPIYRDRLARRLADARASGGAEVVRAIDTVLESITKLPGSGPYTLGGAMPNVTAGRVANAFNLNGPNLVVDAEGASLYQALAHAERQLRSGACRFMLAGGISSSAGSAVDRVIRARQTSDARPSGEAAIMLALTPAAIATELGLPILGYVTAADPDATQDRTFSVGSEPTFLMGAEGAREVSRALTAIGEGGNATVRWPSGDGAAGLAIALTGTKPRQEAASDMPAPAVTDASAAAADVPLRWVAPRWVKAPAAPPALGSLLTGRRVLVLTDQPTACLSPGARAALGRADYRVVCPSDRAVPGGLAIDVGTDGQATRSIQQLDAWPYDVIVILANVDGVDAVEGLTGAKHITGGLLDLMFAVTRHAYDRLGKGQVAIGAICLNAFTPPETVHPLTGLISGFLRSLTLELPEAPCTQVNVSSGDLGRALDLLDAELSASSKSKIREVCIDGTRRFVQQLHAVDPVSAGDPMLTSDSVVIATGGARGVTAVLVEALRKTYGCTTVLLGRTDPYTIPDDIRAMDDETFEAFESTFYQRELAARPGTRPAELKAIYGQFRAAREAAETLRSLGTLPGAIEYIRMDVTDAAQVDAAVQQIVAKYGRIDLVLHGAGIQTSKALRKKRVEEFRAIVATKLGGLGHLVQACKGLPGARPHWHLVTSTFSHTGNDGQEDYGAANLAMDRLAAFMRATHGELDASTLGWIGWVNVGMTRGSEYASLAARRGVRGVTREVGGEYFRELMSGKPASPVSYVITDLEIAYFGMTIGPASENADRVAAPPPAPPIVVPVAEAKPPDRNVLTLQVDTEIFPFLSDHTVSGVPTLPAAFGLELAARCASNLRPSLDIQQFLDVKVERFVKIPNGRSFELRLVGEVLEETADRCRVMVRLMSDFAHPSGRVLQQDILHMSTEVWLGRAMTPARAHEPLAAVQSGWRLADPYLHPDAPVHLSGPFQSIDDIQLTPSHTSAIFKTRADSDYTTTAGLFLPFVLIDALWRMSAIRRDDEGMAPVYVPLACDRVEVMKGIADTRGPCRLTSSPPRVEGNKVHVEWAEAVDATGRVLLTLSNIVGGGYGRVPAEVERIRLAVPAAPSDRRVAPAPAVLSRPAAKRLSGPLDGKVAFVSGSGRGLGQIIAAKLADQGAFVVVNSFHSPDRGEQTAAEIVARGGQAAHVWGSVAQPAHLARIFEQIDTVAGGLDFMVANASTGIFAPIDQFTADHWMRSFRTNVVALHQSAEMAAERMQRRGGGSIVALSSIGTRYCFEHFALVGAVKASVESLVKYLAVELAPTGVQISAVAAGAIDGELLQQHPVRPRWENLAPNGRLLTEDEVADAVLYMLTARGLNGTTIVVDGAGGLRTLEPLVAGVSQGGQS